MLFNFTKSCNLFFLNNKTRGIITAVVIIVIVKHYCIVIYNTILLEIYMYVLVYSEVKLKCADLCVN